MFRSIIASSVVFSGAAMTQAYWYRLFPDFSTDFTGARRDDHKFCSSRSYYDDTTRSDPPLIVLARVVSTAAACISFGFILKTLNKTDIIDDQNYKYFLESVISRDPNRSLITVSNHRSVVDEPCVATSMLPMWTYFVPRLQRWNVCTQEICYFNDFLAGVFFHPAHTFPIKRGGGINQKLLLDFSRVLEACNWVHVFPEAGSYQVYTLGGRFYLNPDAAKTKGRLKWGVGKLIAHTNSQPIIIPYYHAGMELVMPQDPVTNEVVLPWIPRRDQTVTIRVGQPINVSDLIEEHEGKYGKLWKFSAKRKHYEDDAELKAFKSSDSDKILYHKIMNRIEEKLMDLARLDNASKV